MGFDAGKKVKGRKRHIRVDTLGFLLSVVVHPADVQDRDGAEAVLRQARRAFPFIERIHADGGCQGPRMAKVVAKTGAWKLKIVKRSGHSGFGVPPKRWIVERTFAWISRCRRPGQGFRASPPQIRRFHPPRHDPHHAQADRRKPFSLNPIIPERLLGVPLSSIWHNFSTNEFNDRWQLFVNV